MTVRIINEYRFYTTADLDNPLHDRRHRHGIEAKAKILSGTQVRVEVTGVFERNGDQIGEPVKHYYVYGRQVRGLEQALAAMDPCHDEQARSLADLAARNFADGPWFAHTALERLIADGIVTLDQVQKAWDSAPEVQP